MESAKIRNYPTGLGKMLVVFSFLLSVFAFSGYVPSPVSRLSVPAQTEMPAGERRAFSRTISLQGAFFLFLKQARIRSVSNFLPLLRLHTLESFRCIRLAAHVFESTHPPLFARLFQSGRTALEDPFFSEAG
jgi:hypothetical protein